MKNITKTTFFSSALFVLFANIQVWTQDASPAAERKSWRTTVYEAITSPSGLLMAAAAVLIPVGEAIISHSPPQKWISGGRSILRPSPRVYSDPTTTLLAGRLMRVLGWGSLTLGTGLTAGRCFPVY